MPVYTTEEKSDRDEKKAPRKKRSCKRGFTLRCWFISAGQLSQSAHFSLQLPYTIFGLGLTPNFVDKLDVGIPRVIHEVSVFSNHLQ